MYTFFLKVENFSKTYFAKFSVFKKCPHFFHSTHSIKPLKMNLNFAAEGCEIKLSKTSF